MDQILKKKFDLNSATSGAGLAEAIFSCFEVQMMGLRGESMNPMTFGNMTHPNHTCTLGIVLLCPYGLWLFLFR